METSKVTKPDDVTDEIWEDNQRWLKLMTAQAEQHRRIQDPRLYRQSASQHLIRPDNTDNPQQSEDP